MSISRYATVSFRSIQGLALALALVAGAVTALGQPARADDAAVDYVKRVAKDLIAANHAGSMQAFSTALSTHAHVQAIGTYALGSYRPNLKPADRDTYFAGMIRFISRYAATESQKYSVSSLQVTGPAMRTASGIVVDSKVLMRDGQSYDVQWLLQPAADGYRIRDAKVQVLLADYWMTPFLKDLFEKYIVENGSVQALVVALNR
jgi:phospholipid transport system substrate-binding protein